MYTLDKSSSYLGETNRKDILLSVQGNNKKLKDLDRQVCTVATGDELSKRVAGYTILANPLYLDIWLTHLNDRAFNGTEPRIVKLKHPFHVLVRGNDLSAEDESNLIIKELMVPYMVAKRERRSDEHFDMKLRLNSTAQGPCPESDEGTPLMEFRLDGRPAVYDRHGELTKQIILFLDGEYNNLNSLLELAKDYSSDQLIEVIKLAASCSKTQQPADVMKTFLILHRFYYGEQFLNFDIDSIDFNLPEFMDIIENIIKPCDAADKKVFRKYFSTLEHTRDLCCTPHIIKEGWANGLWPPSPRRIMALWTPGWEKLTEVQQEYVLECVRLIAKQIIGINVNNDPEDVNAPFVIGS